MEGGINVFRQLLRDPGYLRQLFTTGSADGRHAPEMGQQLPPPLGPHTIDVIELGMTPLLLPALAVTGDRKAVRFIADMLEQMHGISLGREDHLSVRREVVLEVGPAGRALGDSEQRHVVHLTVTGAAGN